MEWLFGLLVAGMFIAAYLAAKDQDTCPDCGEKTVEVGYQGYKRKCLHCGWRKK